MRIKTPYYRGKKSDPLLTLKNSPERGNRSLQDPMSYRHQTGNDYSYSAIPMFISTVRTLIPVQTHLRVPARITRLPLTIHLLPIYLLMSPHLNNHLHHPMPCTLSKPNPHLRDQAIFREAHSRNTFPLIISNNRIQSPNTSSLQLPNTVTRKTRLHLLGTNEIPNLHLPDTP
jgi:hypothetical protein